MTRDDGTRRTRAMVAACEGISTEALEAGAVARFLSPELDDIEIEDALHSVGIYVWGPDGERFEKMFAAAMKARASALIKGEQQ